MRKILFTALYTAVLFFVLSLSAFAADLPGEDTLYCGESLYWRLDSDGTLTIDGFGDMNCAPWSIYKELIVRIYIGEGAESIAEAAFEGCTNLKILAIPYTMKAVGANAFSGCGALSEVYYAGNGATYLAMEIGEGNEAVAAAESFKFTYDYEDYGIEEAYWECAALHSEFINNIKENDTRGTVDDAALISFVGNVYDYIKSREATLDRSEFTEVAVDAVNYAFGLRRNIAVRNAISSAYPDAVAEAQDGVISDELRPIYNTVRSAVFDHEMIKFTAGIRYVEIEAVDGSAEIKFQPMNIDLTEGGVIVAAVYGKDGVMRAAFVKEIDLTKKDQSVTVSREASTDYVKLFVLGGLEGMKPLGEAKTADLQS